MYGSWDMELEINSQSVQIWHNGTNGLSTLQSLSIHSTLLSVLLWRYILVTLFGVLNSIEGQGPVARKRFLNRGGQKI